MRISATNFKWLNGEEFDLKTLTVMIGENSGGKSTIIKLLLFLKQNLERDATKYAYRLNGPSVKLGQYNDVVRDHNEELPISIRATVTKSEYLPFYEFFCTAENELNDSDKREIESGIGGAYGNDVTIEWFLPRKENNIYGLSVKMLVDGLGEVTIAPKRMIGSNKGAFSDGDKFTLTYNIGTVGKGRIIVEGRRSGLLFSIRSEEIEKIGGAILVKAVGYFALALPYIAHLMQSIDYINPLNSIPTRYIDVASADNDSMYGDYEKAAAQIAIPKGGAAFEKKLSEALSDLGVADEFRLKKATNMPYAEFLVRKNSIESNVVDLGYGVGLQIGVLAKIILNAGRRDKLFIIEQPEVHLHPKLQSKFITAILKYSKGANILIETHSEHLLRKMQVHVKEKAWKISSDNVVVYYFKSESGQKVTQHNITHEGYIEPKFPNGFYDTAFDLMKELNSK